MFVHARKEEGFVRTQTQTQTITVTSADCLGATKAPVKGDDWYKMVVSKLTGITAHTHSIESMGEQRPRMCFLYNPSVCPG